MISVSVLQRYSCCIYLSSLCSCCGGYMAEGGANRCAFPVQIRLMLFCHTGPPADVTQSLVKDVWDEAVTPHSRWALINTQRTRHLSPQWGQQRPALNYTSTYIVHASRILDQFCPSLLPSMRKIIVAFIGKHDTDKDRKTGCRDVEITGSARPSNEPASYAQIDSVVCFFFLPWLSPSLPQFNLLGSCPAQATVLRGLTRKLRTWSTGIWHLLTGVPFPTAVVSC